MKTLRDIESLKAAVAGWRQDGETVALVPTMGNLHKGHMSLVNLATEHAERIVVSVFVNPTQFGPDEDFEDYPRTLEMDRRRLSRAKADALFVPDIEEIYPSGEASGTQVSVPHLSTILCGAFRPGHFDGVTSVVARLFNIVQPDAAVFGQKDYQQLAIIRRMVSDLHMSPKVLAGPTLRESDGLAMSSRNQYLNDQQRAQAPLLYASLNDCRQLIESGSRDYAAMEAKGMDYLSRSGFEPDYFAIRKAGDLSVPDAESRYLVVMAAAHIGKARLIDNILIDLPAAR